ncbi:MAG TPA: hypothetical protein VMG10_17105 [Gemmataceae bacterium]|nr:hypothetical protein [Gemmataceae bacterium]
MFRFLKAPHLSAVLAGMALLAAPGLQTRADYSVEVFDDGVLQTNINAQVVGNSLVFSGTTTHFDISNGSAISSQGSSPPQGKLTLGSNEEISTTNWGTGTQTNTIQIVISQTGYTEPNANQIVLSASAGGSFAGTDANSSVTATYQGYLDTTNTLFGQGTVVSGLFTEPAAGSTPLLTASASGTPPPPNLTSSLVFSPGVGTSLVPGSAPFSLTDVLTFTFTSDGTGPDTANVSAGTVASAPEPATMITALAAMPFLGIGAWLRRRKQAA